MKKVRALSGNYLPETERLIPTAAHSATNCDNEDIERRHCVAQKNQSSLFRIKSHSFIAKSSSKPRYHTRRSVDIIGPLDAYLLLCAPRQAAANRLLDVRRPIISDVEQLDRIATVLRPKVDATTARPTSVPTTAAAKRDSFLRQSLQSIRRSFISSRKNTVNRIAAEHAANSSSSPSNDGEARQISTTDATTTAVTSTTTTTAITPATSTTTAITTVTTTTITITTTTISTSTDNEASLETSKSLRQLETHACRPSLVELGNRDSRLMSVAVCCMSPPGLIENSTCDVIKLADTPSDPSMAVLAAGASHADSKSVSTLNTINSSGNTKQQLNLQKQQKPKYYQSSSLSGSGAITATKATRERTLTNGSSENSTALSLDCRSLNQRRTSQARAAIRGSDRSTSPSRKSVNSSGSITAKHEQSSSTAAAAAVPPAAAAAAADSTDKEKKRKEVSSSRVKKFHRHFSQVSKDEKLINYFSCALVSDILLQGHLYITDQHFAFYSNVFGYVTKVVIPTSSVTRISKEKTAKIIPNAVGVATADERHVFGSFISREAAFRLMCSVCLPLAPAELLPKTPADVLEYSEGLSIEDDSSCSISGNESPPRTVIVSSNGQTMLRRNMAGSSPSIAAADRPEQRMRHSDIPNNAKPLQDTPAHQTAVRSSAPTTAHYNDDNSKIGNISNSSEVGTNARSINSIMASLSSALNTSTGAAAASGSEANAANITMIVAGTTSSTSASSTPSPSTESSTSLPTTVLNTPKTVTQAAATGIKALGRNAVLRLKFPKELHVVYLGVILSIVLALFSGFLLYRILDIEARTSKYTRSPAINWASINDDEIFTEALRWQRVLQGKSTKEAQVILNNNLEQISKVRRSLETLSMLIQDRSSAVGTATANAAEAHKCDDSD